MHRGTQRKEEYEFNIQDMNELNLKGKVAVITGGAGLICSEMARALAFQGVKTVIIDLNGEAAGKVAEGIEKEFNTPSLGLSASVIDKSSLENSKKIINENLFWSGVKHVVSPTNVSKCELVQMISAIYELNLEITPCATNVKCDRTLSSIRKDINIEIPELVDQIIEMRNFYPKLV